VITPIAESAGEYYFVISAIIDILIITIPVFILSKIKNDSFIPFLGLSFTKRFSGFLFKGFLYTFFPFIIVFFAMQSMELIAKSTEFTFSIISVFQILVIFILATQEEILFRGFLMKTFNLKFSVFSSIILSSIIFSGIHSVNHNYGIIASVNTFIAGFILGLMYFRSGSLWLPIFYHFFWNLFQTLILGSNISGNLSTLTMFKSKIDSELMEYIFGNEYGFESSLAAFALLLITLLIVKKIETFYQTNSSYSFRINENSDRILLNKNKKND
jgi:hypothetical protein